MINKKKDPNERHYFTEVSAKETSEVFKMAIEDQIEFKIWEEGKSEDEIENFIPKSYDPKNHIIYLTAHRSILSKFFNSKLVGKSVFLKIGSGKFQFFSTGHFSQKPGTKEYLFTFTSPLFKTQQRSNYRLMRNPYVKIQFRVSEKLLFEALDISAGGTSFLVPKDDEILYAKGTEFTNCRLGLNQYKFDIPKARVMGQWPLDIQPFDDVDMIKIGIGFIDLSKAVEEELFKIINSEARATEMRKAIKNRKKNSQNKDV
jgi:hypothetical protein